MSAETRYGALLEKNKAFTKANRARITARQKERKAARDACERVVMVRPRGALSRCDWQSDAGPFILFLHFAPPGSACPGRSCGMTALVDLFPRFMVDCGLLECCWLRIPL